MSEATNTLFIRVYTDMDYLKTNNLTGHIHSFVCSEEAHSEREILEQGGCHMTQISELSSPADDRTVFHLM